MIPGIRDFLPSGRTLLAVALSGLLGGAVAIGVSSRLGRPSPDEDRMREVGRSYPVALGRAYAEAWRDGADALEQGFSLSASIARVGRIWDANRAELFDRTVRHEFTRIVPATVADDGVSACDRAAMARAWRAFAEGLEGR